MTLSFNQKALLIATVNALIHWHGISPVNAFAPIGNSRTVYHIHSSSAKTIASPHILLSSASAVVANGDLGSIESPKAWECDEDANCVQVDACDEQQCRTTLDVRIHGQWYDLSGE